MGRGTRELHECGRRSVQAAGTSEEGPAGRDIVLRTTEFSYIMSSCHCVCDLEWCATSHVFFPHHSVKVTPVGLC